jgi:hypothetical protein
MRNTIGFVSPFVPQHQVFRQVQLQRLFVGGERRYEPPATPFDRFDFDIARTAP